MLQRPQTLLFIAAAVLTIVAAFAPLAYYSPSISEGYAQERMSRADIEKAQEMVDKTGFNIAVSASGMDFSMNYLKELHDTEERFNESLAKGNAEMDKEIEKRGLSVIFTVGLSGTLLMSVFMLLLVFLYNNRKLQIRMGILMFLITLVVTTGIFIAANVALDVFTELDFIPSSVNEVGWAISFGYGFFLFPLIAVLLLVGVLLVRKDDNLVKSLDRLR